MSLSSSSEPRPSSSEPSGVGPISGGNLRASDADREQVATVLSTAYAEGRLTHDEHDERLNAVLTAKTFDDLVPITQDLVMTGPVPSPAQQNLAQHQLAGNQSGPAAQVDTDNQQQDPERLVAIFGGATRKGSWRVRKNTQAMALFGGIDLDLREAVFEAPVVEISGIWCFGGMDIKVPAGIEVRDQTAGIFGGTEVKDVGQHQPGAPILVVKGLSLFGGVTISGPKPEKKRKSAR